MPSLEIIAPGRLHFGLLSFGQPTGRQFGGAGVLIDRPGLRLRVASHDVFQVQGPLANRVERVARHYAESLGLLSSPRSTMGQGRPTEAPENPVSWPAAASPFFCQEPINLPACRIEVLDAPPEHVGLGTGTQLALSVVAGINALAGNAPLDAPALAALTGRAARSAIGTYGFLRGGLLMESGKLPGETLSPLERRTLPPDEWRFVVVLTHDQQGVSGDEGRRAFEQLPPVPPETTAALRGELTERLFPAAEQGDFATFSDSLYRYGYTSGMCFAAQQGGPFATPRVAEWVDHIRSLGVSGVGQSSWGPAVFAAVESPTAAEHLAARLREQLTASERIVVAKVSQGGATVV
ncbi:MAG: hypothetical protein WD845_08875 [Pirellulales bacterium]